MWLPGRPALGRRSGCDDEISFVPPQSPAPSARRRRKGTTAFGNGVAPEAVLTIAVLALVCIGVVMVYSASSATALLSAGSPTGLLTRQAIFAAVALGAFIVCGRTAPRRIIAMGRPAVFVSLGLLVVVLVPGVGIVANGSSRWLGAGSIQMQPSEFAKLALVIWLAGYLARNADKLNRREGLMRPVVITALLGLLILVEPDLGTAVVLGGVALAMIAIAGAPARVVGLIAGAATAIGAIGILIEPYRRERLLAFIDPWADPTGNGFQIVQAEIALGSGGVSGVGLGNGLQKVFYLPEAHTDMIVATLGEEMGLLGVLTVMGLIGAVVWSGYRIALSAPDLRQRLLAAGLTTLVALQAVVNLGAVLGMLPVTGVPLPFVSYGGSSLVVFAAATGILVGIARRSRAARLSIVTRPEPPAGGDRSRRDGRPHHAGARAG